MFHYKYPFVDWKDVQGPSWNQRCQWRPLFSRVYKYKFQKGFRRIRENNYFEILNEPFSEVTVNEQLLKEPFFLCEEHFVSYKTKNFFFYSTHLKISNLLQLWFQEESLTLSPPAFFKKLTAFLVNFITCKFHGHKNILCIISEHAMCEQKE